MAHGGECVGRADDGRATFVAGGLPGETTQVVVTEARPRFQRGYAAGTIGAASPERVAATCQHFGAWPARGAAPGAWCGGCQWQHVAYDAQLGHKRSILRDALERIGGVGAPAVAATIGMPTPWGYRNKLRTRLVGGRPGLVAVDGRTLVRISACPIAVPALLAHVAAFEADLPDGTEVTFRIGERTGDALIVIDDREGVVGEIEVESEASIVIIGPEGEVSIAAGRSFYVEQLGGAAIGVPATAFFQVNTGMAERLAEVVQAALGPGSGRVVDAYCGIGTLTGAIAAVSDTVVAVDIDASAVAAAVANTGGLANVTLIEGDVAEALEEIGPGVNALVVDPPRGGLDAAAGAVVARMLPARIVYVSCEPTTLARDVRALGSIGYAHRSTQPLDMFPQTYHSESVTVLQHDASGLA
ncbi:MAG: class I SAM-dependent RNA methyltransferase [Ardenticatenales bacterium]|nr:class I SAM-dependent RNA methyltransferase [Ardenticatenales bacterium]